MPTLNDFNEYIKALNQHDWYFEYSDDGSVYKAGQANLIKLTNKANEHTMYSELFTSHGAFVFKHRDKSVLEAHIAIIKAKHIQPVTQE